MTSHAYRMCGHLDAPFAFVSRAGNVTVRFRSDGDHRQASGFSVGYVTYSRTCRALRPHLLYYAHKLDDAQRINIKWRAWPQTAVVQAWEPAQG